MWRVLVFVVMLCAIPGAVGAQPADTIADIRIHGNHTTPDADVRRIADLTVGAPAIDAELDDAERRLLASGRFAAVEVRRRLGSIADPSQILVVIVVTEHPGVTADGRRPGTAARIRRAAMFLPVVAYEDGYGATYGARVSFVEPIGPRSRLSVPLTWGGDRRAALEFERQRMGPVSRVHAYGAVHQRKNPHFDLRDTRQELGGGIEQTWRHWLRTGADASVARVGFDDAHTRHSRAGIHATVDTRLDPSFPRNAVHARVGWQSLWFGQGPDRVGTWDADLRGYVGAGGARVLALRGVLSRADGPRPRAEQALLGGRDRLRGYRAGDRAGDSLAALSAELRWPLTSPLRRGRFGVRGFVDAGTVWATGERLRDQRFARGAGGGVYAGVAVLQVNVDVGWAESGAARGHVGLGVTF